MDSFNFLQREGQDAAEEEADDGGNADDELDDREFEDNRLSIKQRTKQGNNPLSSANVNTQGYYSWEVLHLQRRLVNHRLTYKYRLRFLTLDLTYLLESRGIL